MLRSMLVLIGLLWAGAAQAQLWSGIIDQNRAADWSYAGVSGGIPSTRTNCVTSACNALAPGGVGTVSVSTINAAMSGALPNTVVRIRAGTFSLSGTVIMASNTTLRGAGPTQTILNFSAGAANICDPGGLGTHSICMGQDSAGGGSYGSPQNTANWTANYTKGTSVIKLSASPPVGRIVILDQVNDAAGDPGLNVNNTPDGAALCRPGFSGGNRCYIQPVQIVSSVSDGAGAFNVTITPPIQGAYWTSGKTPGAYWSDLQGNGEGLEDLTIDQTQSGTVGFVTVMKHCLGCWIKNVKQVQHYGGSPQCCGGRAHVYISESLFNTIRDSYFYGTRSANTQSYGIEDDPAGFNLVENNIFEHIVSPLVAGTAVGSVYSYNYSVDDFCASGGAACQATQQMPGPVWSHDAGSMLDLYEGNIGSGMIWDYIHGSTPMNTVFRNQLGLHESGKNLNTQVVYLAQKSRYMNIIGNVLGEAGFHTAYQSVATAGSCDNKIYALGYSSFGGCGGGTAGDGTAVRDSLYRFGNYDVVSGTVRWCGNSGNTGWSTTCGSASEVPTADAFYPQAVPASQTLPASFYLSSQPTTWWTTPWGTPSWPPIGPDVTGGNISIGSGGEAGLDGHAYKIPAQLCYENTSTTGGIKNFNASTCYLGVGGGGSDTTPPSAPTNLQLVINAFHVLTLSWTASTDDVAVTNYFIERCSGVACSSYTQCCTSSSSPFTDTGLTVATAYGYRVRATDAAANLSSYSNTVSGTMPTVYFHPTLNMRRIAFELMPAFTFSPQLTFYQGALP